MGSTEIRAAMKSTNCKTKLTLASLNDFPNNAFYRQAEPMISSQLVNMDAKGSLIRINQQGPSCQEQKKTHIFLCTLGEFTLPTPRPDSGEGKSRTKNL